MTDDFDVIPWEGIRRLAESASDQIAYLQTLERSEQPAEDQEALDLWLPIDAAWKKLMDFERRGIVSRRELTKHPIFPLARQLDAMSDHDDLWTIEAVEFAPPWEVVRRLARELLAASGQTLA